MDMAVARPIAWRRARNMLILIHGLGESKYWYLASRIFVSISHAWSYSITIEHNS
jgi:hypothetical protein